MEIVRVESILVKLETFETINVHYKPINKSSKSDMNHVNMLLNYIIKLDFILHLVSWLYILLVHTIMVHAKLIPDQI